MRAGSQCKLPKNWREPIKNPRRSRGLSSFSVVKQCRGQLLAGCCFFLFAGFGFRRGFAFEGWTNAAFDDAVANAHEFQNRSRASIAESRFGQPQDAGVAAGPVAEAG